MPGVTKRLLNAFREDHALLGRGFHRISTAPRAGELFEAMGRIPETEQASLLDDLLKLRAEHPSWTASAEPPD